ncbi:hypothetical protein BCR42DRAFT_473872 [Absidia repens]|uniref:L domain-like protein n=1 Tax=Absidia repens TaxID=90262 RepID=A0A1X2HZ42_9FUNG|nr:hypothetical protein BCR42DRAFT_473872 [Absidia repens]
MDASFDSHLDLDDRRDELRPTLQPRATPTISSFNKAFLFQHKSSTSTSTSNSPHSNVKTLLLRNNQLTTMAPYYNALYEMHQSLRELTLRNNAFTQFPHEILVLTNLTSLSLAKNQIEYLELDLFPQLSQLTWLSLSHNHLVALPEDLASCRHLLGLDLSDNNFQELPRVISQLNQLQVLLIQKNELDHLPEDQEELLPASLQTLNLAFNQLDRIPSILVTRPPPALTHLHLSGNALGELPSDFLKYGYKNLVSLDLHTCHLSRVPPLFFTYLDQTHNDTNGMIPLRRLNLAINQIRELPSTIGLTTQLQWLNLNDNRLTTLPPTMAHLVHLAKLGLVQNRLQSIPPHLFSRMLSLEKIDLRRNQLTYLPPSILALAPEHEVQQHIDLAVPVTAFDTGCACQVQNSQKTMNEGGEEGRGGGGSLKTLLLYENIHLEQKDGIFVALEYDREDDDNEWSDEEEKEKEPTLWVPLISLEKLKTFSKPGSNNAASLGRLLQHQSPSTWTSDSFSDDCHKEAIHFFYQHLSSLKNIALQHHLIHQQSHIDIDNSLLDDATTTASSLCHCAKSIVPASNSRRLDIALETRHAFLTHAFPSWFPCLLHQNVVSDAQQCDNCSKWSTILPFQVGYLARLCNNRMQVPVRYTVCSSWCALDATLRIQATADNWRTQRLDSAVHLPIPTTNDNPSSLNNNDRPTTDLSSARHHHFHSSPQQHSTNDDTKDRPTMPSPSTSAFILSSSKNAYDQTTGSTSSESSSSSSVRNTRDVHECSGNTMESGNDNHDSSTMPSLTRVLRRVEKLAASLIHCTTPYSPQQQQQQQASSFSASSAPDELPPDINTPSSSLAPLHRPTYLSTSAMIQRLSQLPTPPALSHHDTLRLTDSRPTLTSFNHLPRDAIRLERF